MVTTHEELYQSVEVLGKLRTTNLEQESVVFAKHFSYDN